MHLLLVKSSWLSAWEPKCEQFQSEICGRLRVKQSRFCNYYARDPVTGKCGEFKTKDVNSTELYGCPIGEIEQDVFERHHMCDLSKKNEMSFEKKLTFFLFFYSL